MAATIDPVVFSDLRSLEGPDEPDFLKNLVRTFFDVFEHHAALMEEAIRQGAAEKLWKSAHTLKSSSANVGALELSRLCRELEAMGKTGKLDEATETLKNIQENYKLVRTELGSLVPGTQTGAV
jgi:HPt (histidine-containing phosphotransfer) domain-containing protein